MRKVYISEIRVLLGKDYMGSRYLFDSSLVGKDTDSNRINAYVRKLNLKVTEFVEEQGILLRQLPYYLGSKYSVCNNVHAFDMKSVLCGALSVNPSLFPDTVLNSPVCHISIDNSIDVAVISIMAGNISSLIALGMAYDAVINNKYDYAIAGGFDEVGDIQEVLSHGKKELCESVAMCLLSYVPTESTIAEILAFESLGIVGGNLINTCKLLIESCIRSLDINSSTFDVILNVPSSLEEEVVISELKGRCSSIGRVYTRDKEYMGCNDIVQLYMYSRERRDEQKKYVILLGVEMNQASIAVMYM